MRVELARQKLPSWFYSTWPPWTSLRVFLRVWWRNRYSKWHRCSRVSATLPQFATTTLLVLESIRRSSSTGTPFFFFFAVSSSSIIVDEGRLCGNDCNIVAFRFDSTLGSGVICGGKITEYLLEKSRIVTHAADERNYHVFYELLKGLSLQDKELYGLTTADNYFYLNQVSLGRKIMIIHRVTETNELLMSNNVLLRCEASVSWFQSIFTN